MFLKALEHGMDELGIVVHGKGVLGLVIDFYCFDFGWLDLSNYCTRRGEV